MISRSTAWHAWFDFGVDFVQLLLPVVQFSAAVALRKRSLVAYTGAIYAWSHMHATTKGTHNMGG
jgi:hypothetical protein